METGIEQCIGYKKERKKKRQAREWILLFVFVCFSVFAPLENHKPKKNKLFLTMTHYQSHLKHLRLGVEHFEANKMVHSITTSTTDTHSFYV